LINSLAARVKAGVLRLIRRRNHLHPPPMTKSLPLDAGSPPWDVGTRLEEAATEKGLPAQVHLAQGEELPAREAKLRRNMVSLYILSLIYITDKHFLQI